ncbi:MAG: inositol monophosphatase family protein [Actinomycetota bacterium]
MTAHGDSPDELRRLAVDIAREAGDHARRGRVELGAGSRVAHDTKSSDVDPVTQFDREAEAIVVDRITAARPDDAIVGEEGTDRAGTTGLEWHVDPIDGTVNYVYDLPMWCTSIGVVRDGQPVAGAVYAPMLGEITSASLGGGTVLSSIQPDGSMTDQPVTVSDATVLATSLVTTGFSYFVEEHREHQAARIAALLPHVRDIRRMGSAALDLAFVATGRVEGYFEEFLNSWDVAAGVILVTEAGGLVTAFDGSPIDARQPAGVLAAAPELHAALDARIVR